MFAIDAAPPTPPVPLPCLQVLLNDDNLADIQAEYEGPGMRGGLLRWSKYSP